MRIEHPFYEAEEIIARWHEFPPNPGDLFSWNEIRRWKDKLAAWVRDNPDHPAQSRVLILAFDLTVLEGVLTGVWEPRKVEVA